MWGGKRGLRGSPREPPQASVFTRPYISISETAPGGYPSSQERFTKCLHTAYKEIKNPYGGPWSSIGTYSVVGTIGQCAG